MFFKTFFIFSLGLQTCTPSRILCYIATPYRTHHTAFHHLWRTLSANHQLTLITKYPVNDKNLINLTEIVLENTVFDRIQSLLAKPLDFRVFDVANQFIKITEEMYVDDYTSPEVQRLISEYSHSKKFDLVIVEALIYVPTVFSTLFKCPIVGVTSLDLMKNFHDLLRNPKHLISHPDINVVVKDYTQLDINERLSSCLVSISHYYYFSAFFEPMELRVADKFFGPNILSFRELATNIDLFLLSLNPIFNNVPPLYPGTITIGSGLHLKQPERLPGDLQEYLDNSKQGVIYFSLGSNVKGHLLNDTTKQEILGAFAELPYNVLMKMDVELSDVPKNVKIQKWLPQQDVLRHPNIKLFISQGGLQSLQESITNGIPLVGIPFFGDQNSNVYRMVKKGYGVRIDKKEITKENLKAAIVEVIENPKYREKAKEMGELLHDEPMTSLEKAVWWIEYVIRHKGAKHLRSPAVDMPFYIYYMLDVIGFLLVVSVVALYITYKLLKLTAKKLFSKKTKKEVEKKTN